MNKLYTCIQCGKPTKVINADFCSTHCESEQYRLLEFMGPSQADTVFWNQYRFLQRELIQSLDYVAPRVENYSVYSDKFLSIIRGSCSEIDSACKKIIISQKPKINMADWREYLENKYCISRVCLHIPLFQTYIRPFKKFELGESPEWWKAFTALKHQRDHNFHYATLENSLNAMGALLILNVILLEPVFDKICELRGQSPAYSDGGILAEIESLYRLWGQGIQSTILGGANGAINIFHINKK